MGKATHVRARARRWAAYGSVAALWAAAGARAQGSAAPLPLRPSAIAYDAAGDAFFTDSDRHQVYEATLGGALLVVAGNGTQGFAGDGGAATAAQLNAPAGVAFDTAGNLYIADTGNQRIRRVDTTGTISTIAGNGSRGFSGDGGAATSASLSSPTALAVDASGVAGGALLLCDTGNQRVRRVSGGVITTVAGNGTQGFAGDGGAAVAAELDGPQGIAVASDGSFFVADSRNQRIRVIAANGVISTVAGSGARGFGGDGGAATAAALDMPRGLVLLASGTLVFADSDNRRIRAVSAQGVISTLAGSGVQGTSPDGSTSLGAWLNVPRAVSLSSFGDVTLADSGNHTVQAQSSDSNLYRVAALAPARTSLVSLRGGATAVYGSWNGQVTVSGNTATPLGAVALQDGATTLANASLSNGAATLPAAALGAGQHAVQAIYLGDGINPTATSATLSVTVQPLSVVASANAITVAYGAAIPALTGALTGVLPQDAVNVVANFSTTAQALSPVGSYPIVATLSGTAAANYTLSLAPGSGSVTITQASSQTSLPAQATGSYAGAPLPLRAVVSTTTTGAPTGVVSFTENGAQVAQASLTGGIATANYPSPATGTHTITAAYGGDANFLPSLSAAQSFVVTATPDFAVTSTGSASETVVAGTTATFALNVGAAQAPFTGVVSMSATGLPPGATATFSPPSVVPGAAGAGVTLTITTLAHAELRRGGQPSRGPVLPVLAMIVWPASMWRRRRRSTRRSFALRFAWLALPLGLLCSCGTRTAPETAVPASTYNLTVTGTGTNVLGDVVSHSIQLTLVVQ